MLCHGQLKTQLQEDSITTSYIAKGVWVCSPQLPCTFGRLASVFEPQEVASPSPEQQRTARMAEDSRNAKLTLTKTHFGSGAAELSSCDDCLVPSTYLSLPQSLSINFLPISSKGKGCRQKYIHKHKL